MEKKQKEMGEQGDVVFKKREELVTQITEDIIQGILNVISTYEQEV